MYNNLYFFLYYLLVVVLAKEIHNAKYLNKHFKKLLIMKSYQSNRLFQIYLCFMNLLLFFNIRKLSNALIYDVDNNLLILYFYLLDYFYCTKVFLSIQFTQQHFALAHQTWLHGKCHVFINSRSCLLSNILLLMPTDGSYCNHVRESIEYLPSTQDTHIFLFLLLNSFLQAVLPCTLHTAQRPAEG